MISPVLLRKGGTGGLFDGRTNRDDQASMLRKLIEPTSVPCGAAEFRPAGVDLAAAPDLTPGTSGKRGRKLTQV